MSEAVAVSLRPESLTLRPLGAGTEVPGQVLLVPGETHGLEALVVCSLGLAHGLTVGVSEAGGEGGQVPLAPHHGYEGGHCKGPGHGGGGDPAPTRSTTSTPPTSAPVVGGGGLATASFRRSGGRRREDGGKKRESGTQNGCRAALTKD